MRATETCQEVACAELLYRGRGERRALRVPHDHRRPGGGNLAAAPATRHARVGLLVRAPDRYSRGVALPLALTLGAPHGGMNGRWQTAAPDHHERHPSAPLDRPPVARV